LGDVSLYPFEAVDHIGEPVVAIVDTVFKDEEAKGGDAVGKVDDNDAIGQTWLACSAKW